MPSETPSPSPENPINRTADSKEELEKLKLAWVQSATRIGEAERAIRQTEADAAGAKEALRRLESSSVNKLKLMLKGSLKSDRAAIEERIDSLAVILERHKKELVVAQTTRATLKETIAAMETELKKPKLCDNRLNDFKKLYGG